MATQKSKKIEIKSKMLREVESVFEKYGIGVYFVTWEDPEEGAFITKLEYLLTKIDKVGTK